MLLGDKDKSPSGIPLVLEGGASFLSDALFQQAGWDHPRNYGGWEWSGLRKDFQGVIKTALKDAVEAGRPLPDTALHTEDLGPTTVTADESCAGLPSEFDYGVMRERVRQELRRRVWDVLDLADAGSGSGAQRSLKIAVVSAGSDATRLKRVLEACGPDDVARGKVIETFKTDLDWAMRELETKKTFKLAGGRTVPVEITLMPVGDQMGGED